MTTEPGLYSTVSIIHNGYYPPPSQKKKLHDNLRLLNLCPGLYILMQKAVILNTCHVVTKFLAEE
jgi:hypothetical protein